MSTESKKPKTVEVKMLVPYAIIVAAIVAVGFFITGFHVSQRYNEQVKADATNMVTSHPSRSSCRVC